MDRLEIPPFPLPTWHPHRQPLTQYPPIDPSCVLSLLSEGGEKWLDRSGHGNDGTVSGATPSSAGRHGPAWDFDADDDYIQVANSVSLQITGAISIMLWFLPDWQAMGELGLLLSQDPTADAGFYVFGNNQGPDVTIIWNPAGVATGLMLEWIPETGWIQVVFVNDGLGLGRGYINGTLWLEEANEGEKPSTDDLYVGSYMGLIGGITLIDEVKVWNRAITASEVLALYEQGR
jgi:hypothetical protein